MSILACLIGILTLMISVITQLKEMDREGQTEEEVARAKERRDLVIKAEKMRKEIAQLDQRVKKERASAAELEELKDRQIVLRDKLDDLTKAKDQSDAELQKIAENLKKELAALQKEQPALVKRAEELRKQLKERKEAPEPPKSVQVRPGGSGLNKASNIFFVECHSTGINILEKGGKPKAVSTAAIPNSGAYKDFLAKVKGTRDSMVLYLIRKAGNESYLWAASEARNKFEVNTGKLPLPNDGPIDLSLFD
ncbi:hypothetical protein HAHE_16680 [Haloferula helveola]|uniref:Uncharacterized protein n=1 Tax=Haloferula helveola TaxID=490095 RepID=A0ABM7R991_9BACT|nr:hypothetical protein HAHE_16680 [Haloferula helveola]